MSFELMTIDFAKDLIPPDLTDVEVKFSEPEKVREKIHALEAAMIACGEDLIQIKTTHRFTDGLYLREIFIPAGTIVVGRIHKHACMSVMSQGEKITMTENGVRRLKAPFSCVSKPGIKRVGLAVTDCTWVTIHQTLKTNVKDVEEELFTESYDEIQSSRFEKEVEFTMEGKKWQE
jgi:hypothetical protein